MPKATSLWMNWLFCWRTKSRSARIVRRSGACFSVSGLRTKKDLQALEQKRADVTEQRHHWTSRRQPFMAHMLKRIAFIDETWLKTNMAKPAGWAPRGERLVDYAPFDHWRTQTFVAALRHDRLDAPWVIDGTMNRNRFETYVETQLALTLKKNDVVILDNLSSHKSPRAAKTLRERGAWFLFLPPYSPDLNLFGPGMRWSGEVQFDFVKM